MCGEGRGGKGKVEERGIRVEVGRREVETKQCVVYTRPWRHVQRKTSLYKSNKEP